MSGILDTLSVQKVRLEMILALPLYKHLLRSPIRNAMTLRKGRPAGFAKALLVQRLIINGALYSSATEFHSPIFSLVRNLSAARSVHQEPSLQLQDRYITSAL